MAWLAGGQVRLEVVAEGERADLEKLVEQLKEDTAIAAADTADRLIPLIHEEHDMDQVMALHDFWLILTGSCILHPWWNKNADTGHVVMPFERCSSCQRVFPPEVLEAENMCPVCGAYQFEKALDPDGRPAVVDGAVQARILQYGRGQTDVLSPFEWASPPSVADFRDVPLGIRLRWRPWDWVEERQPKMLDKLAKATMPDERSLQLLKAIASLSDIHNSPFSWGGGELSEQRRKALRYYLGEPFGNEIEGRSKVVSTDVSDTIEWILPSLLKIFTAGDDVVRRDLAGAHRSQRMATGFPGDPVAPLSRSGLKI